MCCLSCEIINGYGVFDHIPDFIKKLLHPVFSAHECCPNIRAQEEVSFSCSWTSSKNMKVRKAGLHLGGGGGGGGKGPPCQNALPPPLEFANTM